MCDGQRSQPGAGGEGSRAVCLQEQNQMVRMPEPEDRSAAAAAALKLKKGAHRYSIQQH